MLRIDCNKAGYRFIDTAAGYGNEKAVGQAIRKSGIPRDELYESGLHGHHYQPDNMIFFAMNSLLKENLDIFDFSLTRDEMEYVSKLDTGHNCFPARNTGAAVENFLNLA